MNKKKIILIGGGGHCKSCIDVIESNNMFDIVINVKRKLEIIIKGIADQSIIVDFSLCNRINLNNKSSGRS